MVLRWLPETPGIAQVVAPRDSRSLPGGSQELPGSSQVPGIPAWLPGGSQEPLEPPRWFTGAPGSLWPANPLYDLGRSEAPRWLPGCFSEIRGWLSVGSQEPQEPPRWWLPGIPGAFQVAPRGQVAPRSQEFPHPKGSRVAPESSWGLTGAFQGKISLNYETMACWLMHED